MDTAGSNKGGYSLSRKGRRMRETMRETWTLPLARGGELVGYIQLPRSMTQQMWDQMMLMLEAIHSGVVDHDEGKLTAMELLVSAR